MGYRSKFESGKAKFYGQLLESLSTELEISIISESNSVLKAAHAKGSGGMLPLGKFLILVYLRWHSRPFWANQLSLLLAFI